MKKLAFVVLALFALAGGVAVVSAFDARPALAGCSGSAC